MRGRSTPRRLLIIGIGDHARVVLEALRASGREPTGFLRARRDDAGTSPADLPVLGDLESADGWISEPAETSFLVAIGNNHARRMAFERAISLGLVPEAVVHPSATMLTGARIGGGTQICAQAIVGVDAVVGVNVIVNTAASIDHDNVIEDHASVGPGAHLAGRVTVGQCAHVGIGAAVREGIRIGVDSVVGAGAAVIRTVPDGTRVAGVPAQPLRRPTEVVRP